MAVKHFTYHSLQKLKTHSGGFYLLTWFAMTVNFIHILHTLTLLTEKLQNVDLVHFGCERLTHKDEQNDNGDRKQYKEGEFSINCYVK